ncbi:MAG: hypothetical protein KDE27_19060 [Planctomycetes bacterium]|nr:hypothetical protein [Planctomycetota bacterium]
MVHLALARLAPLAFAATAFAQGCLDQSYLPNPFTNGLEITANQPVTQTFTVGITGQLTQIELSAINHHQGMSTNNLQVDIVTTANGVPTATSLATVTFAPAAVPLTRAPLLVDLTPFNVQVTAGQVLGIALTSPNVGHPSYAWWGEAPASTYAGGQIFIQQTVPLSVWDLSFQSWVDSPASWSNYGTGHPGTNGIPSLTSSADPVLGTTPALLIGSSASGPTLGAVVLGVLRDNSPTAFGGTALVQVLGSVVLTVPSTGAQLPLGIPSDPSFCGLAIDAQSLVFDAGASHGIAFSAGLEYVIGS